MAETASLPEVTEACVSRNLRGLHTACLGHFTAYADSLATVQPQELDGVLPAPIESVPVVLPGDWVSGDPCLLVFSEEQFSGELASTGSARRHGLYAVAVPLVARPGQSTDFVALAGLVLAQLEALRDAINGWVPVPTDGGAALKVALQALFIGPPIWPASVAASKLRAR